MERLKTLDTVDLHIKAVESGVSDVQICRTCTRNQMRLTVSAAEANAYRADGGDVADLKCQPVKFLGTKRVHADRSITKMPAVYDRDGEVLVENPPTPPTMAFVDSCGQELMDKCRTCSRLVREVVYIQGGVNANGRAFQVQVLVGGHCSIPAEGIQVGGRTKFCDKKFRLTDPLAESKNCSTCANNTVFGNVAMLDHSTPLEFDLSPYEYFLARENAPLDDQGHPMIGLGIWMARMAKGQARYRISPMSGATSMTWFGLRKFFRVVNLGIEMVGDKPARVKVRIPGTGEERTFSCAESNPRFGIVHIGDDPASIVLEFISPYHRDFGFAEVERFRFPSYGTDSCGCADPKKCERCMGAKLVAKLPADTPEMTDLTRLIDPSCPRCGSKPCYYHAKGPSTVSVNEWHPTDHTAEHAHQIVGTHWSWRNPGGMRVVAETPERVIRLVRENGTVMVTDGNGNAPDVNVFRIWKRSVISWCKTEAERTEVNRQFWHVQGKLHWSRPVAVNLGWNRFVREDPWHSVCSLNKWDREHAGAETMVFDSYGNKEIGSTARGINFSVAWNDSFGTPRSDMSTNPIMVSERGAIYNPITGKWLRQGLADNPKFSWAKAQDLEEWLRVTSAGERIQDECIASERHLRYGRNEHNYMPWSGMPARTIVTNHGVGISNSNIVFETVAEAVAWLDGEAEMPDGDKTQGFRASNRWMTLGYENFRNTKRLLADDIPSVFEFNHSPHSDPMTADAETSAAFICTSCYTGEEDAGRFDPSEIDGHNLTCPNPECGGTLVWWAAQEEWAQGHMRMTGIEADEPTRRIGSPTGAAVADSRAWLSTERLMNSTCDNWRARPRQ